MSDIDVISQFRAAAAARGLLLPDHLDTDGKLHRCELRDGAKAKKDGAYLLHLDGVPAGGFQNFRDGLEWENWRADIGRSLTPEEEAAARARMEIQRAEREAEAKVKRDKSRRKANAIWNGAKPAPDDHPYLQRKGVLSFGLRVASWPKWVEARPGQWEETRIGNALLVPMRSPSGTLHSLQAIYPEKIDGRDKDFLPHGEKAGKFHLIGEISADVPLCVAEGYATAASLHQVTGWPVAVAFDAGSLEPVSRALREAHPAASMIVCADDDHQTDGNPGRSKAEAAARAVGGVVAVPTFGPDRPIGETDFNDLATSPREGEGPDAVRRILDAARDAIAGPACDDAPPTAPTPAPEAGNAASAPETTPPTPEEKPKAPAKRSRSKPKAKADGVQTPAQGGDVFGVLAEDLLPGMATQLQKLYGNQQVGGFVSSWNQLTGAVTEAVGRIGQTSTVMAAAGITFGALKETVLVLGTGILTVSEGFGLLGKTIGSVAGAISSGNWSGLREEISKMAGESAARINDLASKTAIASGVQQAFGQAVTSSGNAAATASPKFLLIQSAYTEVNKVAQQYTDLAQKAVDARNAEAEAAMAVVKEFGTEAQQRAEAAKQAEIQSAALQKLADAKNAQAKIAEANLAAYKAEAAAAAEAGDKISTAKQDEINKLTEAVKIKTEEAAKTLASAEASKINAAAVQTETQTYADNSKRVFELRDAWKTAASEAEKLHAAVKAGTATKEEAAAADIKAGQAVKLYRDALSDATAAAERHAASERVAANLQQSALQNDLYRAGTILEIAKQRGNEKDIAEAQIAVWRIELEISEAQAQASRLEAEAMLIVAKAKRAELEASGALTEAKKAELAVMDANIKAKQLEAEKFDLIAARMKALSYETKELKSSFFDLSSSTDDAASAADRAATSYDGLTTSIRGAAAAKDGFTRDASGNVLEVASVTPQTVATRLKNLGVSDALAAQQATQFFDAAGNTQNTYGLSLDAAVQALADRLTGKGVQSSSLNIVRVDLTTNRGTSSVKVASQADATALVSTLQELAARS